MATMISATLPSTFSQPAFIHSGGADPIAVSSGTDATAVNTETYIVEVFIPTPIIVTGVSVLHLASSTGNVKFQLANFDGSLVANAATASTAAVGSAAYQQVPFAATVLLNGPQSYFVLMQNSGSNHYRAHALGNFRAGKKTGETYGTFTAVTTPTGFSADVAPICDLYV